MLTDFSRGSVSVLCFYECHSVSSCLLVGLCKCLQMNFQEFFWNGKAVIKEKFIIRIWE